MTTMKLTIQQQQILEGIQEFMNSDASVYILRGYAGTGKTTMVKQIADFVAQKCRVALMAPTGRAARVLETKTGRTATTIHKTIYGKATLDTKKVDDIAETEFKLCFPIDKVEGQVVAIVDEASMLCSRKIPHELFRFGTDNLMDDLLTYVRPSFGGKVIFVGDPAQLPPVGELDSQALNEKFFQEKGLKVMKGELTEVLRQKNESAVLKNAMKIRELLEMEQRNHLVFEEKQGEVESLSAEELLDKYMATRKDGNEDSVVICFSNQSACQYNKDIREELYGGDVSELRAGDRLMVVQNNYQLNRMNGEFVSVLSVGEKVQQSAPVYVQKGGLKVKTTLTLNFQHVQVPGVEGKPEDCLLLLDLLNDGDASLGIEERKALYINFCMRHPLLKPGTEAFANAILADPYYNCLQVKYGYAVTGHKCQGGEWSKAFVDYTGRTGMSDDCLRWAYTATTRARDTLYIFNLPHITPFSKFRIEEVQKCTKMNEECRVIEEVPPSPYHEASAPNFLHAKCRCIMTNLEYTPYQIESVVSKPYQEIYQIRTPDGVEAYDVRYKKGGVFLKAAPQKISAHNVTVGLLLNSERAMPLVFNYLPSDKMYEDLYHLICSACDGLNIQITNVVEHKANYHVMYYFRTSDTMSSLQVYIDADGFVTYAKPMSLIGQEDKELMSLIEEIKNHFE